MARPGLEPGTPRFSGASERRPVAGKSAASPCFPRFDLRRQNYRRIRLDTGGFWTRAGARSPMPEDGWLSPATTAVGAALAAPSRTHRGRRHHIVGAEEGGRWGQHEPADGFEQGAVARAPSVDVAAAVDSRLGVTGCGSNARLIFVSPAPPRAGLIAPLRRPVEPLVHAPESV